MPATNQKKITFNDDTYTWLMALTHHKTLSVNATLQEHVDNNSRRDMNEKISFMHNKR